MVIKIVSILFLYSLGSVVTAQECAPNTEIWTLDELRMFSETIRCVDGDLSIGPSVVGPIVIDLPVLERVSGVISFSGGILKGLKMESLVYVGGLFVISMPSYPQLHLEFVSIPKLSEFHGEYISVGAAPLLTPDRVALLDPVVRSKLKFK